MSNIEELKQRYIKLNAIDGINKNVVRRIEELLSVKLPEDFCQISCFFSGGFLGGISSFAFAYEGVTPNIVEETLRLRNASKLPSRYIFLAEPPESIIVMDTENIPAVIWCDATDVERISNMSFIAEPKTWATYMEFFIKLLGDEEEEQTE